MDMMKFKVVEIFSSINGEGMRAGELAVFVRMQGCNLQCTYCDTQWANQADARYTLMTVEEICEAVIETGIKNVTLTGGEPLKQLGIESLIQALLIKAACRVEIETNGSVEIRPFIFESYRPVFTMDYKLPGSGMEAMMNCDNFSYLCEHDTVKFVVSHLEDLIKAKAIIEQYELVEKCHVIFSPVFGKIEPAEIVEFMKQNQMNDVRLQLQLHKFIWDPMERGV